MATVTVSLCVCVCEAAYLANDISVEKSLVCSELVVVMYKPGG